MARRNTVEVVIKADDQASRNIKNISGNLGKLGTIAAAGIGAAVVATSAFAVSSVKAFAGFERQMNEVFTLLPNLSQAAMDDMTKQVKDLSLEFGVVTDEVVPALYQAISAGVPPDNVFEFMEIATKASIGGITSLETAVDGITSVVNAYGAELVNATQASDLLFTAVRLGKTNFDQLSRFMFQVIPTAASLGVEFGNVTAAMATITAQGVPTRVAATQMRQLLIDLSQAGGETADTFTEMAGKSFKDFIAEGNNVQDALRLMEQAANDSGLQLSDMFTSVQAGNAAMQLTGTAAQAFSDNLEAMNDSAGATEAAFDQMNQGILPAVERLQAAFNVLRINFGQVIAPLVVPVINKVREAVAGIALAFDDADSPLRKVTDRVVAFIQAFGAGANPILLVAAAINNLFEAGKEPFDLAVINGFVNALSSMATFIGDLVSRFVSWKDVLIVIGGILGGVLLGAVFSVLAALAPLALLFAGLVGAVALFRNAWESDFGGIRTKTEAFIDFIKNKFLPAIGFTEGGVGEVLTRAGTAARNLGGIIVGTLALALQTFLDFVDRVKEAITTWLDEHRGLVEGIVLFVVILGGAILVVGAIAAVLGVFTAATTGASIAVGVLTGVLGLLASPIVILIGAITLAIAVLHGVGGEGGIAKALSDAAITAQFLVFIFRFGLTTAIDFVKEKVEALIEAIGRLKDAFDLIPEVVGGDNVNAAVGQLKGRIDAILGGAPIFGSVGRQGGGQVQRGRPVVVGEGGSPELFIPDQDGSIQPGDRFGGFGGGGGGITIIFNGSGGPRDNSEADRMGAMIVNALRRQGATL